MFLYPLHVEKKMEVKLRSRKAIELSPYKCVLYAPTHDKADEIIRQSDDTQHSYLENFSHNDLYMSYTQLQDSIVTSWGVEAQMSVLLRTEIRSVEPHKMLKKVILTQ